MAASPCRRRLRMPPRASPSSFWRHEREHERSNMILKHAQTILAAVAAAALVAGAATAASPAGHASLVIRHQVHGCHTWSVDGGLFRARQSIALHRGGWITV